MAKEKYTLVGVDGNAYAVMGYVRRAMQNEGFSKKEQDDYTAAATSGNYDNLLVTSLEMIDECNLRAR